jgi:hypothetical protein
MFKLRRLYVDTIGVPSNRFVDLCVDATDLADQPCDTIVWLRNGAGKTTMLSLLLALVLPDRRDFLASRVKRRTLEDLVNGPDTAHVIAEWVDSRGQRLISGAVYQWEGRTRPRDYNGEGKSRLKRYWWCLHPDEAVDGATFETVPTTSRTMGAVDLEGFGVHIGNLAAQGVNATGVERIGEWHEALRQRHFDPDLFRYFAEVNASEGGVDALFAGIDSAGAFVRYLLRFVADERRVAPVRDLLGETAAEIAKRPVYVEEREFCRQAQVQVAALGEAHSKVRATAETREGVRVVVAGFKRALLDAADAADQESDAAGQRRDALEAERAEQRQRTDAARRQRDEYKRLAAVFRFQAATLAAEAAGTRAEAARLNADAWAAVPDRAAVVEAEARLEAHRQALRSAAEDAAPQLAAYEAAQAELAGSLEHHLVEITASLEALADADTAAEQRRDAAEAQRRAAVTEQADLRAEQGEHGRIIERVEAAQRRLVERGHVEPGERLTAAAARLAATAERQATAVERVTADIKRAGDARAEVRAQLPAARQAAEQTRATHEGLRREALELDRAATDLAADARLRQLAQADDIDPITEATDLLTALATSVAAADSTALDLRLEGSDDERAIAGLEAGGILPPRQAVEQVIRRLDAEGIGAQPGWRYLKEHHTSEASTLINRHPEVADGVVVYSDPHLAAQAAGGLDLADPVVIARASTLATPGAERVVVGPSPARYDPSAAADELARRRTRSLGRGQQLRQLAEGRRRDETLAARLRHLLHQVPADGREGLAARTAAAHTAATTAAEARDRLSGRETELDKQLTALRVDLAAHQHAQQATAMSANEVDAVLRDERELAAPARARLEALPGLLTAAQERETAASDAKAEAESALESQRNTRAELNARKREWAAERAALAAATPSTRPLEACRAALAVAEAVLKEHFPEAELRRTVDQSKEAVKQAMARYQRHKAAARTRAERFFAMDPAAQDADLRAAALDRSKDEDAAAQRALGAAEGEVAEADAEVKTNTPADRARHTTELRVEPADRADALRLASEAAEEAAGLQADVGRLERERDDAAEETRRWNNRAGVLRDQADKLASVQPAELAVGEIDADEAQVRRNVAALIRQLDSADGAYQNAASGRSQGAEALRNWALQDRFAKVADDDHGMAVRQLRDLLRGENLIDRVAPRAGELAVDLATREQAIAQQIAQVETHKRNVVVRLADLVAEALSDLTRASTLSVLPEGIGPWAGLPFLSVGPRTRPSPEQVQVRVGELVEQMVGNGKVALDPVELLWQSTNAAVIDGFRASILKPSPDQPQGRTPVEDMQKWSGGENLTASLVLFCVLAKLRTENRTGTKAGATGGVVPLDNPLGKANYLPFLELQRKVAAANGVQLLFWTGIGDLAAVGAFPRITAMRKRPAVGRPGVAYVVTDEDASLTGGADKANLVESISAVRAEELT